MSCQSEKQGITKNVEEEAEKKRRGIFREKMIE